MARFWWLRGKKLYLLIALVFLCVSVFSTLTSDFLAPSGSYVVERVVDGDTIVVREPKLWGDELTVRLLGVDTPESVDPRKPVECFGKEASSFLKNTLPVGSYVYLDGDKQKPDKDRYGRLLRYVLLQKNDISINQRIIASGYGYEADFGEKYSNQKQFKKAEEEARQSAVGLWGNQACKKN